MRAPRPIPIACLAIAATAALVLTGCGSSKSASTPKNTATVSSGSSGAAALVPAAVKSKGTVVIAMDASYPPDEFFKPGTTTPIIGFDADLGTALGKSLGLNVQEQNVTFDAIIPGLQDGKYDIGLSSFTDTQAREKVVDFVTYFQAGESFYVKAGGKTFDGLDSLCGAKVAVENGTTEQTDAQTQSKTCTTAGKPAVTVLQFSDQSGANLAVSSGRADVGFADSPPVDYIVQQSNGQFVSSGKPFGLAPYGVALPKGNGMAKAVQAAMKELISNGQYAAILKQWNLSDGAITDPMINGATS